MSLELVSFSYSFQKQKGQSLQKKQVFPSNYTWSMMVYQLSSILPSIAAVFSCHGSQAFCQGVFLFLRLAPKKNPSGLALCGPAQSFRASTQGAGQILPSFGHFFGRWKLGGIFWICLFLLQPSQKNKVSKCFFWGVLCVEFFWTETDPGGGVIYF